MRRSMGYVIHSIKALLAVGLLIAGLSGKAHADGTQAGTNVQISYSLDYKVSGVSQTTIDTSASGSNTPVEFTVDRRIDLTVSALGNTDVVPGAQDQDLLFQLTNEGNDVQAYALLVVNEGGDDFSATGSTLYYYIDDGDGLFEPGADDGAAIVYNGTATSDLAADRILFIAIRSDIPSSANDAGEDIISIIADTLEPTTSASPGTPVTADGDGNTQLGAAENVLADGSGTSNEAANAGDHSASASYVVDDPLLVLNTNDSGAGSLRAAIIHANAYVDADNISFVIPGGGVQTITLGSALPAITDANISIDGLSQSGASCGQLTTGTPHDLRIMIDGAGVSSALLPVQASDVTVQGLSLVRGQAQAMDLNSAADNAVLRCNYIGVETDGTTAAGNGLVVNSSGIRITDADSVEIDNNLMSGNGSNPNGQLTTSGSSLIITGNIVGMDETGTSNNGAGFYGLQISGGSSIIIGGASAAERNLISQNHHGVYITGSVPALEFVNNYVGTDITGLVDQGNRQQGLHVVSNGGPYTISDNVISSNHGGATATQLLLAGTLSATLLRNKIGVGADGTTVLFNQGPGLSIGGTVTVQVGDGTAVNGNIIAGNGSEGINISGTAAIIGNRIYGNGALGINLAGGTEDANGVTANDSGDGDSGANDLLNFPVINTITASGSTSVMYNVNLDVPANTEGYRIEFYKNSSGNASGHGEGETFLGFVDTGDHPGGSINFDGAFTASEAVSSSDIISTTATRKTGVTSYDMTSEFSANYTVVSALIVTNTNDSGAGSLRQAIENANADPTMDDITFAIPNAGPHVINLVTSLPTLTDAGISIDGTTQSGANCGAPWEGTAHTLEIVLDGAAGATTGLRVHTSDVSLKGLSVVNMTEGLYLDTASANTSVTCNHVGLTPGGIGAGGVRAIRVYGANTVIGGSAAADGNVISGNTHGIALFDGSSATQIQNNFIGTDPVGENGVPNTGHGIIGWVGTYSIHEIRKNLISGNGSSAIHFDANDIVSGSSGDLKIAGNYMGVDRSGNAPLPNGAWGIFFNTATISGLTIGGTALADRNIIAANNNVGVDLRDTVNATILNNYIGVGDDGQTAMGNNLLGIRLLNVSGADIGNGSAAGRNIVANTTGIGIAVTNNSTNIDILGNYIGADATGAAAAGNTTNGLHITDSDNINIGNGTSGGRNIIADSGNIGLFFTNGSNITVNDNYIGVLANGTSPAGNTSKGIVFNAVASGTGFTSTTVLNNVISNNGVGGIDLSSYDINAAGATSNITFQGNKVGVAADSITPAPNIGYGIKNTHVPGQILIGGANFGDGNIIAHNTRAGVIIQSFAKSTTIIGNSIHSNDGLGIELRAAFEDSYDTDEPDVVTMNDSGDGDSGANDLLNFPIINMFSGIGTSLSYDVNLDVPSNIEGYRIEFFKNTSADPSGYGEGEIYLGYVDTGSHPGGSQPFTGTFTGSVSIAQGDDISATTTRKTGASSFDITSEFSLNYSSGSPTELTASKSVDVYDPTSAGLYSLPGNDVISALTVTNPGAAAADTDSIVIIDEIPAEVEFYNGDIDDGGPESNPVSFVQTGGANLTFTYANDVKYSNSGLRPSTMAGCTYTPSAGYDPNVTFICFNPKGAMASGNPDPTFTASYRARIK